MDTFKSYAEADKDHTMINQGIGQYMCYCKHNGKATEDLRDPEALCHQYFYYNIWGLFLTNMVAVLVSFINIIIRTVNISLIDLIGFHTQSQSTTVIMTSIFVSTFINTGVILLFTNADLQYSVLSWIPLHG